MSEQRTTWPTTLIGVLESYFPISSILDPAARLTVPDASRVVRTPFIQPLRLIFHFSPAPSCSNSTRAMPSTLPLCPPTTSHVPRIHDCAGSVAGAGSRARAVVDRSPTSRVINDERLHRRVQFPSEHALSLQHRFMQHCITPPTRAIVGAKKWRESSDQRQRSQATDCPQKKCWRNAGRCRSWPYRKNGPSLGRTTQRPGHPVPCRLRPVPLARGVARVANRPETRQ